MYRIAHQYGVEDLVKLCLLALAEADITSDLFYEVVDLAMKLKLKYTNIEPTQKQRHQ